MKLNRLIIMILGIAILMCGCDSVKRGLSGQKKKNIDEFLVQKKNPLVLPPHFGELPKPMKETDINDQKNEIDLTKVFKKSNNKKTTNELDTTLEKSILKKINTN